VYRNVGFNVILYGFETWFLALREEQDLRMLETRRAPRKIFGSERKKPKIGQ